MPATTAPKTYHELAGAKWTRVPTEAATETYDIMAASNGSVGLEELFGEEPEFFQVHHGDLKLSGPQNFELRPDPENRTVFVIDGDLTIDGPLSLVTMDIYTPLWIRGSLTVTDLVLVMDCCLFVEKSLQVKGALVSDLTDAGHLIVHGATSAKAWVQLGNQGCIEFAKEPETRRIGGDAEALTDALAPEVFAFKGSRYQVVRDMLLAGKPILK